MKKTILSICCFLPAVFGMLFAREVGLSQIAVGFTSFCIGLIILISQKDIKEFKHFNLLLFIGTIVGYIVATLNVSRDVVSLIATVVFAVIGAIGFLIQYGIGYLISKKLKRNR